MIMKHIKGIWCKKIGMTQFFQEDGILVPVTILDASAWRIIEVKQSSLRLGLVRRKFADKEFSPEWLSKPHNFFQVIREVGFADDSHDATFELGSLVVVDGLEKGDVVTVSGVTIGRGFQGGVKRHGFTGGPASHGGNLGRRPGSMGFMRSRGRVIKNWRMAGHMGVEKCTVRGLKVIATEPHFGMPTIMIKGSVPGKTGSLVFVGKV
jgi:large subunit ribosomal protein L3